MDKIMNSGNVNEELLRAASESTVKLLISELKKNHMLKGKELSPFQKTETLLYNYKHYKAAVEEKMHQIDFIMKNGVGSKSKSITTYSSNNVMSSKLEIEKREEQAEAIMHSVDNTQKYIKIIDGALDSIRSDQYYRIIEMKYFEELSNEEIAAELGKDKSTISRNKNRLINILKIRLFADEVLEQLFKVS